MTRCKHSGGECIQIAERGGLCLQHEIEAHYAMIRMLHTIGESALAYELSRLYHERKRRQRNAQS